MVVPVDPFRDRNLEMAACLPWSMECDEFGFERAVERFGHRVVCWDNAAAESFFSALKMSMSIAPFMPAKLKPNMPSSATSKGSTTTRFRHSALNYRKPNEIHYSYQPATLTA